MSKGKKPAMTIDQLTDLAGKIIDEIPEKFFRNLNGGFNIVEDCKKDGEYLVMGEYLLDDIMGSTIMIYYGSFVQLLGDSGAGDWEKELRETILHELRHHIELMAGVDYLSEEEAAELEAERLFSGKIKTKPRKKKD
ncbi:MAG: metallopeptidase family protein [Bacillota bacterium]